MAPNTTPPGDAPLPDTALDAGLGIAFGIGPPRAGSSVIAALAQAGASPSAVSLRSPASEEPGPVVQPVPESVMSRSEGRYQVLGEIARGGVGVVLRGHDVDLGRDVAIKVLKDTHAGDPDVLRRFVEEAQIGGQLQHPGVVPVYEMGLRTDRRPYFSMKLVKGRTLAALLAERTDPSQDRRRMLSIFESVCQTVAYAHSRGVIHRDLKPSNVMVGAFGEVLVVDWGLAKVLREGGVADERKSEDQAAATVIETVRSGTAGSQSLVGSVMGTLAYMPPEQAMGQVALVDERSDVFSLGAVLSEILTGKAPYLAADGNLLQQAAKGDLAGAHERLRSSGADAALVDLAVSCLAPAKAVRPKDASVVAAAVAAHLASAEERAREAAAEAKAAREREEHQRALAVQAHRARRLAIGLATSVAATVLLGGGGWWLLSQARATREAEATRAAAVALDEAAMRRGEALAASDPLPAYEAALAAARRADSIARTAGADATTRDRATALLAALEQERQAAAAEAEAAARDRRLLERIEEIRMPEGDDPNGTAMEAAWATAFRDYGVEPEGDDPAEVARRIRERPVAKEVAVGLEGWAAQRRWFRPTEPDAATRLERVAELVDPDPTRKAIREAADAADPEPLRALARTLDVPELPIEAQVALSAAFWGEGDAPAAAQVLRTATECHPGSAIAHGALVNMLIRLEPPANDEALRHIEAVAALRPRRTWPHLLRGHVLQSKGDFEGAIETWRDGMRIRPDHVHLLGRIADAQASQGREAEALETAREAIRLAPGSAMGHLVLGRLLAKSDPEGSLAAYREAARVQPTMDGVFSTLAEVLRGRGDLDEAVAAAREEVRLRPVSAAAHNAMGVILQEKGDREAAAGAYRESIRLRPDMAAPHANLADYLLEVHDDRAGAIQEYRIAAGLAPTDPRPWWKLALALLPSDLPEATEAARRAVAAGPEDAAAHTALACALEMGRDLEGAETAARRAVGLYPEGAPAHNYLGSILLRRGDVNGAVAAHAEAARLAPDSWLYARDHGAALERRGDSDGALEAYRDALRRAPKELHAHAALIDLLDRRGDAEGRRRAVDDARRAELDEVEVLQGVWRLRYNRREFATAASFLHDCLSQRPDEFVFLWDLLLTFQETKDAEGLVRTRDRLLAVRPDLPFLQLVSIRALLQTGETAAARSGLEALDRRVPGSATVALNLSQVLEKEGRLGQAIDAMRDAVERAETSHRDPIFTAGLTERDVQLLGLDLASPISSMTVRVGLARLLMRGSDWDGVVRVLRSAQDRRLMAVVGGWEGARLHLLGLAHSKRGDVEAALPVLREAQRHPPGEEGMLMTYGQALEGVGELDRALDAYRQATRLDPKYAKAHAFTAQHLLIREDLAGAEAAAREAIRLDPDEGRAHLWLGGALLSKGDLEAALAAYRRAEALEARRPEGGRMPIGGWADGVERMIRLLPEFEARLAGTVPTTEAEDAFSLARMCHDRHRYAASVAWTERALALRASAGLPPPAPGSFAWQQGAVATLRAAKGEGEDARDLSDAERARLRSLARSWLRSALRPWAEPSADDLARHRLTLRQSLEQCRRHPTVSPWRDDATLATLPEAERAEWRVLWADFDAAVERLRPGPVKDE